jgi:hypothetical protein
MHNHNGRPPPPAFTAAARMPIKDHFHHGRPFRIEESDVAKWLCACPEIMQDVFNKAKMSGAIVYVDGRWIGAQTYNESNK